MSIPTNNEIAAVGAIVSTRASREPKNITKTYCSHCDTERAFERLDRLSNNPTNATQTLQNPDNGVINVVAPKRWGYTHSPLLLCAFLRRMGRGAHPHAIFRAHATIPSQ